MLFAFVATGALTGTAAADAPDCSTVTYNGDGTTSNPYEVGNVDQLQCIEEQGLDANYEVVSDIDASGTSGWNGGDGFEPIGEFNRTRDTEFNGTFNGRDHNITGLTINREDAFDIGMFSVVGRNVPERSSGTVTNIGVVDADINVSNVTFVGGLAGGNAVRGNISGSYVTGKINRNNADMPGGVGGLVGGNGGIVTDSFASASINGTVNVGGLIGRNVGILNESYATGGLNGFAGAGGLVGTNLVSISESYATGVVNGSTAVGGLAGRNRDATINESYAAGRVNGSNEVGGLVGLNSDDATVDDSYWDTETTGQSTSAGNALGLNTSEMTGSAATNNMIGFDFTTTWETVTNPDDYPILAFQTEDEDDPAPPNFDVTIDTTNSPVTEGDTLMITATVTNTGGQQGTQDIIASASGLGSVIRTVMLNAGESTTETVSVPTSSGDAGTYTVTVESENDTATTTVTVNPAGGNTPPTASFTFTPNSPDTSDTVMFDASGSSDPDGTVMSYDWDFGDGTTASGETATHSFPGPGDYTVTLTVTDDDGATDTTTQTVSVTDNGGTEATVESSDVRVGGTGETGESAITVDAENGMSIARLNVSVDTSVAEITSVSEGADVDSSQPSQTFNVIDQTADSARIEYSNLQAQASPVQDFELACIEFESQTDDGETPIQILTDELRDGNTDSYGTINEDEGTFSVGAALFEEPLPGFNNPPTNTVELDPHLYEDVSGDGDGLDPSQSVTLWTELVLNPQDFNSLTQEQIDALNWNGDGQLTPADAVSLWTEQVLA